MNRKVVDLTIPYKFHKGSMVFFSIVLHKLHPKFECQPVSMNRSCWQLTKISTLFHSKLETPSYMKVVSSTNWTTFILVNFEVFR
jgi:hypothetical protein